MVLWRYSCVRFHAFAVFPLHSGLIVLRATAFFGKSGGARAVESVQKDRVRGNEIPAAHTHDDARQEYHREALFRKGEAS